jgi:hypothetical protein
MILLFFQGTLGFESSEIVLEENNIKMQNALGRTAALKARVISTLE